MKLIYLFIFFWLYRKNEGNYYDFLSESARGGRVVGWLVGYFIRSAVLTDVIFGDGHKIFPQLENKGGGGIMTEKSP